MNAILFAYERQLVALQMSYCFYTSGRCKTIFSEHYPLSSFLLWQSKFSPQARARVTFIPTRFMAYKLVIATNTETVLRPVK